VRETPNGGVAPPNSLVALIEQVRPSVVNVSTEGVVQTLFGRRRVKGVGTGFVIRSDGVIVTNYHVVENADTITVHTPPPDGGDYSARVIGGDARADLAVLKIDAKGLPPLRPGDSGALRLGDQVVALGFALGLKGGPTVTTGIVSGLGRTIHVRDRGCEECKHHSRTYRDVIQTDAAINPGNSGGPLVNMRGEVVGINTAGASAAAAENIGFAIAIDAAEPTIDAAVRNPSAPVAFLGLVAEDVTPGVAVRFDLPVKEGARVVSLARAGPAAEAGIEQGEVIVSFEGAAVPDADALERLLAARRPGEVVAVGVATKGGTRDVSVTLGTAPLT
jgi:serine protease Do